MKPNVLVAYPLLPRFMAELEAAYVLHRLDLAKTPEARETVLAVAGPVSSAMVVNGHVAVDRDLLDRLPRLQLAACSSAGFDLMDLEEMTRRGITLTNTSDALVGEVANMAVLLMLAARRRLIAADAYVRSGAWGREGPLPLTSSTFGKRVGIVGLGNIGLAIARRCMALGMEVSYFGRREKPGIAHAFFADLIKLADWADILIISTPGGAETEGLISAAVLAALGSEGTFVNVSRGSVVDEAALIGALREGVIASAGLDVYRDEPCPDPALTALGNVVLYPHHASGTEETRDRMARLTLDNLAAFFAGQPLLSPVNHVQPARRVR